MMKAKKRREEKDLKVNDGDKAQDTRTSILRRILTSELRPEG